MPAIAFNPLAALVVHSQVDVDAVTFNLIEDEAALLIHGCKRRATRQDWRRYNKDGKLIVWVRHSPQLTYHVTATSLYPLGENLGNFHPGRCLSDRVLGFVNGGRTPFQFERETSGVVPGKFVLLDPEQDPGPGDATEVSFTVEHAFVDLDTDSYPASLTVLYEDIAVQAVRGLTEAGMNAVLKDVFQGASECTGALTGAIYNGDPAAGGTILMSAPSTAWTATSEPGDIDTTRDSCPEIIFGGGPSPRSVTHIRIARPAFACVDFPLPAPLSLPAWTYLRVGAADLIATLTWPHDGEDILLTPTARLALRHLLGDTTTGIVSEETTLLVSCYDGDPDDGGVLQTSFTVPRDSATWEVATGRAENKILLTGGTNAPPGNWVTEYITVTMDGLSTALIKSGLSGSILTLEGDQIEIPAGVLFVDLD